MTSTVDAFYSAYGLPLWLSRQSPHGLDKIPYVNMITQEEIAAIDGLHTEEPNSGSRMVLLAEDDPALRRYIEVVLQRAGYSVLSASDGLQAMKFLLSSAVDLIVTDAIMPHFNGYELCRFVRSTKHLAHLPIVLLSALDPKNAAAEKNIADAFLAKPISPETLLECLAELATN